MKWKIALSYNRLSKVQNVLLFVVISTSSNCFLSNYYKGGNGLTVWRKRDGETSKIKAWKYFQLFSHFTALRKHNKKKTFGLSKGKMYRDEKSYRNIEDKQQVQFKNKHAWSYFYFFRGKKALLLIKSVLAIRLIKHPL